MTVDEAYRNWQDDYWIDSNNILAKTINGYISIFERHIIPMIGSDDVSSIDYSKVQKHYDELAENGYALSTIKNIHKALSSLLSWCYKKVFLDDPIFLSKFVTYPKSTRNYEIQYVLTVSEYHKLIGYLSGHYRYAIEFISWIMLKNMLLLLHSYRF